jgi:hypothetical protein
MKLVRQEGGIELVPTALSQLLDAGPAAPPLAADLLSVALDLKVPLSRPMYFKGVVMPELSLTPETPSLALVEFQECFIEKLELRCLPDAVPTFYSCIFLQIEGAADESELPPSKFLNCEFDSFTPVDQTSDAIMDYELPEPLKVGLSILNKLYMRQGTGRKDSALRRGMPPQYAKYVNDVVGVLLGAGMVVRVRRGSDVIWVPVKAQRTRASRLIEGAPAQDWDDDELVARLLALG